VIAAGGGRAGGFEPPSRRAPRGGMYVAFALPVAAAPAKSNIAK